MVFPLKGNYKLDVYATPYDSNEVYGIIFQYVVLCSDTKQRWNALPRNRNKWGLSHGMEDLGLVPITHHDAVIETQDGHIEIRFNCSKEMVRKVAL